jgi:hypothetical protein
MLAGVVNNRAARRSLALGLGIVVAIAVAVVGPGTAVRATATVTVPLTFDDGSPTSTRSRTFSRHTLCTVCSTSIPDGSARADT